ncbi:MAG: hypothetical protein WA666_09870 [Nitrospirota bacterium]
MLDADYLQSGSLLHADQHLHDITGAPVVLVGMNHISKKLARYPHLYNRISQVVKFQPLDESDIALAAMELCELELNSGALKILADRTAGKFREVMVMLDRVEQSARKAGLKAVDSKFMETIPDRRTR